MHLTDRLGMTVGQALVAWSLVLLIGGPVGLASMLLCQYLLSFGGGDSADKHGISVVEASRVGGVAIVAYFLLFLLYLIRDGRIEVSEIEWGLFAPALAFFAVGLWEDLNATLSSSQRFITMFVISLIALMIFPSLVLVDSGVLIVDWLVSTQVSAILFTSVCLAFIPNAFNTADGANGLISGVAVIALWGFSAVLPEAHALIAKMIMTGTLIFMVFNLVSGRFFLGDGGAYFLGAFCGAVLIITANTSNVSTWWMLALIFYPVADLLWSMIRRVESGTSPLYPDNQHLHNLVFALLKQARSGAQTANTLTGLGIACLFSGVPLLLQFRLQLPVEDDVWIWVVVAQWAVYIISWQLLSKRLSSLV